LKGHFQIIWSPSFYNEKNHSQVEDIQDYSFSRSVTAKVDKQCFAYSSQKFEAVSGE